MSAISDYLEIQIIDYFLRKSAVTSVDRPNAVYLSLHTSSPGETGSTAAEVSGNAYARQVVTFTDSALTGYTANSSTITFPTATGSWGTITHWGLWDAAAGGNMLLHGAANTSVTITTGNSYTVVAGQLTVLFD